jgi:hypothetical protein
MLKRTTNVFVNFFEVLVLAKSLNSVILELHFIVIVIYELVSVSFT